MPRSSVLSENESKTILERSGQKDRWKRCRKNNDFKPRKDNIRSTAAMEIGNQWFPRRGPAWYNYFPPQRARAGTVGSCMVQLLPTPKGQSRNRWFPICKHWKPKLKGTKGARCL